MRGCSTLLNELRELEAGLAVVTAPDFGYSTQDSFMLNILASFAELEHDLIASRIAETGER